MDLIIIAGGKGSRMGHLSQRIPKALIEFDGKPLVQYQIESAVRQGIEEVLICTGHLGEMIQEFLGDGSKFGLKIKYSKDPHPLGTSGAVAQVADIINKDCFVFYGDTFFDVCLDDMRDYHASNQSDATLFVHPNSHPSDSDLVEIDRAGKVLGFNSKPHVDGKLYRNLVSAALYIISPKLIELIPRGFPTDFGKDIFPLALENRLRVFAYKSTEYIKDMGTPERKDEVLRDLKADRISRLRRDRKKRAVFLDRDGVVNFEDGQLANYQKLKLIPGAAEAIRKINESGWLAIIVTNQSVVARSLCTFSDLEDIHKCLEMMLGEKGAYIDEIYTCPHHPDGGYPEERVELKITCSCRKPAPGLIKKAAEEHIIDLSKSIMIGDRDTDVQAGIAAGLACSIKITSNQDSALLSCVNGLQLNDYS